MFQKSVIAAAIKQSIPAMIIYVAYGIPFGVLATSAGLPPWASVAMSFFVLAGTAQFMALQLLAIGSGCLEIMLATFLINFRHFFFSSTLATKIERLPISWLTFLAHVNTDETFGINMAKSRDKLPLETAFVMITGIMLHLTWTVSTLAGVYLGSALPNVDLLTALLPIFFAILLGLQLHNRFDVILAIAAGGLTYLLMQWIPGNSPFLITAIVVPALGAALIPSEHNTIEVVNETV